MCSLSKLPKWEARTPAVQQMVAASSCWAPAAPPRQTRPGEIDSTFWPSSSSTPESSRWPAAAAESGSAMVGNTRSTRSTSTTRQSSLLSCLKSRRTARCINSTNEPANSQPAGPAPTTTTVCRKARCWGSSVCSASSRAISNRRRISSACSRIFIGGARGRHSSRPK